LKKKGRPAAPAKPPDSGERKALRKRIVLSNTNALAIPDLEDLSPENMGGRSSRAGQVLGLPDEVVDKLRAVEAFKPKQGWAFFRRPAVLLRKEAAELGKLVGLISEKSSWTSERSEEVDEHGIEASNTVRSVICGEKGAGKSVLLLEAMAMAFLNKWVVISIPEGMI
jgi:small subunit ribosomal protein S29